MPMRGQRIEKGGRRPGCSLNKAGVVAAGRQGEKESVCPAEGEGAQGEQQEACSVYVLTNRRQLAVRRCAHQSVGSWSARTPQRGWQHGCAPAGCGWQGAKGWARRGCGWGGRLMAGKAQPPCRRLFRRLTPGSPASRRSSWPGGSGPAPACCQHPAACRSP